MEAATLALRSAQAPEAEEPGLSSVAMAKFVPRGAQSGPPGEKENERFFDPTIFWLPNRTCVLAMVDSAGFVDVEMVSDDPRISVVVRARSPLIARGEAPDQMKAPWS